MGYYGREGELRKLWLDEHDETKSRQIRYAASKARETILDQLRDPVYCALRERQIKAAQAHDEVEEMKIVKLIRDYMHEDRETGMYE